MPVTVEHSGAISCLGCGYSLPLGEVTADEGARCPRCQSRQRGVMFKAAFQPPVAAPAAPSALAGEASCFQHPTKRAAVPCDSCGRFLCTLCQFTIGNQNLCPACIAMAREKKTERWVSRRLNLDSVALTTALVPMIGVWTTVVSGPMAIYVGIRALNQAPGPVPRGRWRAVAAIILGILQVVAWIALLLTVFGTLLFRGGRLG